MMKSGRRIAQSVQEPLFEHDGLDPSHEHQETGPSLMMDPNSGFLGPPLLEQPLLDNDGLIPIRNEENGESFRVYPERWVMLLIFSLSSAIPAVLWITFAPIASVAQDYYGVTLNKINALSIVYLAAYLPFSIVSSWIYKKYGVRNGLIFASALNCMSALLRFLSTTNLRHAYAILLTGQIVGATAQPFFTNMPARIASIWFGKDERDLAVVISFLANPFGTAVGNVIPAFYTVDNAESFRISDMLFMELVLSVVMCLAVSFFFLDKPPTPPSTSESNKINQENDVMQEIKMLLTNKDFVFLVISVGMFAVGLMNCILTILEQLIQPAGYTPDDASLLAGSAIICGIVSAIGIGIVMDRTHMYNVLLKAHVMLSAVVIICLLFSIRPGHLLLLSFLSCLLGIVLLPLTPLAIECACECTYPVSEDLSAGVILSAGQVSGIVLILLMGTILGTKPTYTTDTLFFDPAYIPIATCSVLSVVFGLLYQGKYLRLETN